MFLICSTDLLPRRDCFAAYQTLFDTRSTGFARNDVATRLEHRIALLLGAENAFIDANFAVFELRLLRLLLRLVVGHIVSHVLVIHRRCLDVFGVFFVIAFDEYFTQVGVTAENRKVSVD